MPPASRGSPGLLAGGSLPPLQVFLQCRDASCRSLPRAGSRGAFLHPASWGKGREEGSGANAGPTASCGCRAGTLHVPVGAVTDLTQHRVRQDAGLWPEQAAPRGVRIRPGGLCLSWGWTCRHCQGLGDRRAGANVLSIWFQLLVAELLVASLPHLGLSVRCFHSPAPVWALPGQGAGLAPVPAVTAVLPCPRQPGPAQV